MRLFGMTFWGRALLLGVVGVLHCPSCAGVELLRIAVLMQGSDFINISVVPSLDVNQFDLGDVFISPCRAGMFNERINGVCKDCSVCGDHQFEAGECLAVRNRYCTNCSMCSAREQEICACGTRTTDCYIGDRVCTPLVGVSVNITFKVMSSNTLSALQERFIYDGMNTGFVLFLLGYLGRDVEDITLTSIVKQASTQYQVTYVVRNVYSAATKSRIGRMDESVVQQGLASTFGMQFLTRRRLLQTTGGIQLSGQDLSTACISAEPCNSFFFMSDPEHPCNSTCIPEPCPPGFSGDFGRCVSCPNATFKPSTGNETCSPCPSAYTSNQGSSALAQCWALPATDTSTSLSVSTSLPATTSRLHASSSTAGLTAGSSTSQYAQATSTTMQTSTATPPPVQTSAAPSPPVQTSSSAPVQMATTARSVQTSVESTPREPVQPGQPVGGASSSSYYYHYVKSGVVQYITVNENGGGWNVGPITGAMSLFFIGILLVGARLFMPARRGRGGYTRVPSERREIPVTIIIPVTIPDQDDGHPHDY